MNQGLEHRKSGRRRTIFGGVMFAEDGRTWDCSVADVSESGVKAKAVTDLKIGDFVDLKINKFNDLRRCEVKWIREREIGLEFTVVIDMTKSDMSPLFKLIRS